jgi:threonine/homoserine/homoserine lactone efflux protein
MNTEFFITSLIVVASPGTGTLVTLNAGLSHGTRTALIAALGCTLGIIPHMLLAITGLATILHANPVYFEMLKYAGVLYLIRMAWLTLKEKGVLSAGNGNTRRTSLDVIRNAVLVNLLNPKLSLFFFAFLPQFIKPDERSPTLAMLSLSLIFMLMTLFVFALYGIFSSAVRERILASHTVMNWLRRSFAAAFVALGIKLALTQQ